MDNTNFQNNGDMTLFPDKAIVKAEINGAWYLELHHSIDGDGRWKYLIEDAAIKVPSFNGEQLFRISEIEKSDSGIEAVAYPIFLDARNEIFLTDVRPTNLNGQQALNTLLEQNSKYAAHSDISRTSTAYYEYMNMIEALNGDGENAFVNRWGGEILYDNYKIIVNERIGGDYGVEIRYGKNIKTDGISEEIDMSEVATRIYPKSFNGHRMTDKGYVDSTLINKYPIPKCTTITFEDVKMRDDLQEEGEEEKDIIICDTQTELDDALTKKCEEQFRMGLDKPKVTIEADMVLLQNTEEYKNYKILESVSLGDTVHCRHNKLGIVTDARVISLEYDCLLDHVTSVKLGDFKTNYFNDVTDNVHKIESVITPDGGLMADKVQGILDGIRTQLRLQSTVAKKVNGRAFIAEDLDPESPLYGCIAWGTQGIEIAKKRTADGRDWDWSTAMTANGIVANAIITGLLADKTGKNFWNLDTGEFRMSSQSLIVDDAPLSELVKNFTLDIRKNHPSSQSYDPNTKEYVPDYTKEPLVLEPSTKFGTNYVTSTFVWKRTINGQDEELGYGEDVASNGVLTISQNIGEEQQSYICYATYNDGIYNYVEHKIVEINKISDGMDGSGIPGEPGDDGRTSYVHFAYANSSDGSVGFSTIDSVNKLYIGQYTDFELYDSTDYRKYKWSKIRGEDGEPGKDAAIQSPTEPTDKTQLWLDTSADPPLLKRWNGIEWVIVNDTTGEIESLRSELQREIGTTADGIKLEVSKNYYTKGEAEQLQSSIGTQFEQSKKDFEFKFNEFNKDLTDLENGTNAEFQNIQKYIRFEDGNIEMGMVGNEFKRLLTRTKDSYLQNGVEIAYFGNRKLYVMDGEFTSSCMFGNFGFFPEENESLSFRKAR